MPATIHLSILDLPDQHDALNTHWPALLNTNDAARYQAIVRPARRVQFLLPRLLLADAASRASGAKIAPADIAVQPSGRPSLLDHPALAVGISHSRRRVVTACGNVPVIGLDVEWRNPDRSLLELAERTFEKGTAAQWAALPANELLDVFYQRWTQFEARYKAALDTDVPTIQRNWLTDNYQHCLLSNAPFELAFQQHTLDTLAKIYCHS